MHTTLLHELARNSPKLGNSTSNLLLDPNPTTPPLYYQLNAFYVLHNLKYEEPVPVSDDFSGSGAQLIFVNTQIV